MTMTVGNLIGLLMLYPVTTKLKVGMIQQNGKDLTILNSDKLPNNITYEKVLNILELTFDIEGEDSNDGI